MMGRPGRANGRTAAGVGRTAAGCLGVERVASNRPGGGLSGFSLMETIVAIVILGVGLLVVAGGMVSAIASDTHAAEQARASFLAVQKMEALKATKLDEVTSEPPVQVTVDGVEGSGPYLRSVDVVGEVEGPYTTGVTVTVEYGAGRFGQRQVQLYTVLFTTP